MRINVCDKCGKKIKHPNRVHIYNYTIRKYGEKRRVNRPKRNDFDLCNDCRKKIIKWMVSK